MAGCGLLTSVGISDCRTLSSLCVAALRSKMVSLTELNVSSVQLGESCFEWVAEGCRALKKLDLSKSPNLTNRALVLIG